MKKAIFIGSAAAALTTAAIILFRQCRKKKQQLPSARFSDLYEDNSLDDT